MPPDIRDLLGPAPITELEDEETYERILGQVAQAVSPGDFVEWLWIKDIVDLTLDANRCRRAKVVRLAVARRSAIQNILSFDPRPRKPDDFDLEFNPRADEMQKAYDDYGRGDKKVELFAEKLERRGLTEQSIGESAYLAALDDLERLQHLIDAANARRDAVLREIDRRRDSFARRARPAVAALDNAIDAEFE